jgi:hypothetical protein
VLRRAWNWRVSFLQDSGDAGAHQASLILIFCNGLCFGACYKSSLWAQKNSHFTWPVASCGNGRYLMPVANMSYQQRASDCYLSWLICNTWSVTGAFPITKGGLRPLPKPGFHVVRSSSTSMAWGCIQVNHDSRYAMQSMLNTFYLFITSEGRSQGRLKQRRHKSCCIRQDQESTAACKGQKDD